LSSSSFAAENGGNIALAFLLELVQKALMRPSCFVLAICSRISSAYERSDECESLERSAKYSSIGLTA